MTSTQVRAKELFDKHDVDDSGTITLPEFKKMLPALGINLSLPKAVEYFHLCDQDNSGHIDFEEFKVALFVCDSDDMNPSGFNPGNLLRPKDAFDMFDRDSSGQLDEDEFHFVLKFLGIHVDERTLEQMFRKYDRDRSGCIEYTEFRKVWLQLVNPRKELAQRNIHIPTLATKSQLVRMLDEILEDEEKKEKIAVLEAKRFRERQLRLKSRTKGIENAFNRSCNELSCALDCGGQIYCFGRGTLDQFGPEKAEESQHISLNEFKEDVDDVLVKLWNRKIRGANKPQTIERSDKTSVRCTRAFPFEGLNVQQNTAALWGKCVIDVAIGDSTINAYSELGEVFSWGGNHQWWHEIEKHRYLQHESRDSQLTARSNLMQGHDDTSQGSGRLSAKGAAAEMPACIHSTSSDEQLTQFVLKSSVGEHFYEIKRVLQYYGMDPKEFTSQSFQNLVKRERLKFSLNIRGRSSQEMTKIEMLHILNNEIVLECKILGEVIHLHLRELETEILELRRKRKMNLAKRRQAEFTSQRIGVQDGSSSHTRQKRESKILGLVKSHPKKSVAGVYNVSSLACPSTKGWKMIASGPNHKGLLSNDGQLYMYGLNTAGCLGLPLNKRAPSRDEVPQPRVIALPKNARVSLVSCGHSYTAAICNDGKLFTWGSAASGKLGLGDIVSKQKFIVSPLRVHFPTRQRMTIVSCGANHCASINTQGNLFMWGCNGAGKLGLGDFEDRSCPIIVDSLLDVNIVDVSCGFAQTLAISKIRKQASMVNGSEVLTIEGGLLFAAGQESCIGSSLKNFGQYTSFMKQSQPVPPKPICSISAGFTHQAAVTMNGELFVWGDNHGGCCGQPFPGVYFVPKPTHVDCLYNKPNDLGINQPTYGSSPYGNQPFYEIDLQEQSTINEIILWNKLVDPPNPAIRKEDHTKRLFPCWIMISQHRYPPTAGEGALCNALKESIAFKRFEANTHCSIWCPPRKTMGRYIRVQLEEQNLLEFEKLEVFGNVGLDNSTARVSFVRCGKKGEWTFNLTCSFSRKHHIYSKGVSLNE